MPTWSASSSSNARRSSARSSVARSGGKWIAATASPMAMRSPRVRRVEVVRVRHPACRARRGWHAGWSALGCPRSGDTPAAVRPRRARRPVPRARTRGSARLTRPPLKPVLPASSSHVPGWPMRRSMYWRPNQTASMVSPVSSASSAVVMLEVPTARWAASTATGAPAASVTVVPGSSAAKLAHQLRAARVDPAARHAEHEVADRADAQARTPAPEHRGTRQPARADRGVPSEGSRRGTRRSLPTGAAAGRTRRPCLL